MIRGRRPPLEIRGVHPLPGSIPERRPSETAFLVLTDATIRRWCGPSGALRLAEDACRSRPRGAAGQEIANGGAKEGLIETQLGAVGGVVPMSERGPYPRRTAPSTSSRPLPSSISKVSKEEAAAYERFRREVPAELAPVLRSGSRSLHRSRPTGSPRTSRSCPYRGNGVPRAHPGDPRGRDPSEGRRPHPESIFHVIFGVDKDSEPVKSLGNFASSLMQGVPAARVSPLGWLGARSPSTRTTRPVWAELSSTPREKRDTLLQVPVRAPVRCPGSARGRTAFSQCSAASSRARPRTDPLGDPESPGYPVRQGVAIGCGEGQTPEELRSVALYYAARPGYLVLTLDEEVFGGPSIARPPGRRRRIAESPPGAGRRSSPGSGRASPRA